jgi:hypothetical protein
MKNPNNATDRKPNTSAPAATTPTPEEYAKLLAQVQELQAKVDRKKRMENGATSDNGLRFVVAEKGGISVYGLGRFPVTLYYEQWVRLLDAVADLRTFMGEMKEAGKLTIKAKDDEQAAA